MESRIERAFFDGEQFVGRSLDVENDAIAMGFPYMGECFEDEEIETALEIVARQVGLPLDN